MPRPTMPQLVLLEIAATAALGGLALHGTSSAAGVAVGAVLVLCAVIPVDRRWLYQHVVSCFGLLHRRRSAPGQGLAGVLGQYSIETIRGGTAAAPIGVVRQGTTWSIPLVLGVDDVFNGDRAVPVTALGELLHAEDIQLSSVRLITVTTPARVPSGAPAGPYPPLDQLAARYCLLTIDSRRAGDAIAARGGSTAAVAQVLRRATVHAEQVLAGAGISAGRLDETAVAGLFPAWLGPVSPATGRRAHQTAESWRDVRVAGVWSTVAAVIGKGADVADRVTRLVAAAPTPVAATALVLRPARGRAFTATMLLRLSAPDNAPRSDAVGALELLARAYDLGLQRMGGEQGVLLAATSPVGLGEAA
ncbi:MAG TPA: type VII secretion protein EccE [Jatrophihabitans sp.]|nr:type VII secretion protein EccE [Jatrophihabitans sp.]